MFRDIYLWRYNKEDQHRHLRRCENLKSHTNSVKVLDRRGPTDGTRATSDPRQPVTRPEKLFVNLLLVTTSSFIFFALKDLKKKNMIRVSSAALRTSATHDIDFRTLL
jgi:hypothetical protein